MSDATELQRLLDSQPKPDCAALTSTETGSETQVAVGAGAILMAGQSDSVAVPVVPR